VVEGKIECPYHGWRFDGEGRCTLIPFCTGETPKRFAPALKAEERHGLVFVHHGGNEPIHTPAWEGNGRTHTRIIKTSARTGLLEVMENVLDFTHTAFTHKNLMRRMTDRTKDVTFVLEGDGPGLLLTLHGETEQNGLIGKLSGERNRSASVTRIRRPGIVEAMYYQNGRLGLVTTVSFSPVSDDRTDAFITLTTNLDYGLAYLRAAVFLPMFKMIIRQDQRVLSASRDNWIAFGRPVHASSPLDFMRPNLQAMLGGETPPAAVEPLRLGFKI
jgi:phenylpropionate dioxygenase-like ring-hydroxylating dioxygenase large terminal subunit